MSIPRRTPIKSVVAFLLLCTYPAHGQVGAAPDSSLRFARVVATDMEKSIHFYETVFSLQEIERGKSTAGVAFTQLNFGRNTAEAQANPGPRIFLLAGQPTDLVDAVSHMAFMVSNTPAAVDRAVKAGGQLTRAPYEVDRPEGRRVIAFVKDPAGNLLELIAPKQ